MTLEEVKNFLRVDGEEEDTTIAALMTAARDYIIRATGKMYIEDDAIWNQAIKLLVAHWFENRGPEVVGTVVARFGYSLDMLIQHISLCSLYQPHKPEEGETP